MERISLQKDRKAIIAEHVHRYQLSSLVANGNVLDISCGIGYGSKYLSENKSVSTYVGIDISDKDIEYAKNNFKNSKVHFQLGDINNLSFSDQHFDTVVCLETLEHLNDPTKAVIELSRVLKDNGILVGSIPEDSYDYKCEEVYGPNPYHLQHFSQSDLIDLLKKGFSNIEILRVGVTFGTLVSSENSEIRSTEDYTPHGSLFFIASKGPNQLDTHINKIQGKFIPALSMLDYDAEFVLPLRNTISDQEKLIQEKDKLIFSQNEIIKAKDDCIGSMENMINDKDQTILTVEQMVRERDKAILAIEEMVRERDVAITSMEKIIDKRWEIIQEYEVALRTLRGDK